MEIWVFLQLVENREVGSEVRFYPALRNGLAQAPLIGFLSASPNGKETDPTILN